MTADAFAGRLFGAATASLELATVYFGDRHVRDASNPGLGGPYDLITLFDSLHHLARPGETLRALRAELAAGGTVLIAETVLELAADAGFSEAAIAPIEHEMLRFFVLH